MVIDTYSKIKKIIKTISEKEELLTAVEGSTKFSLKRSFLHEFSLAFLNTKYWINFSGQANRFETLVDQMDIDMLNNLQTTIHTQPINYSDMTFSDLGTHSVIMQRSFDDLRFPVENVTGESLLGNFTDQLDMLLGLSDSLINYLNMDFFKKNSKIDPKFNDFIKFIKETNLNVEPLALSDNPNFFLTNKTLPISIEELGVDFDFLNLNYFSIQNIYHELFIKTKNLMIGDSIIPQFHLDWTNFGSITNSYQSLDTLNALSAEFLTYNNDTFLREFIDIFEHIYVTPEISENIFRMLYNTPLLVEMGFLTM
jgi:hypothetical protein